jgi:hypothetical protein
VSPKRRGLCQKCFADPAVRALQPKGQGGTPKSLANRLERHPHGDPLSGDAGPLDLAAWEEFRRKKRLPRTATIADLYDAWLADRLARAGRRRRKKVPGKTTSALPGTAGKLDVLAERARLGLPLFGPADADFVEGTAAVPIIAPGNFTTVGRRVVVSERDHRRLVQAREVEELRAKKEPALPPPLLSRPAPPSAEGLEQVENQTELPAAALRRTPPRQHASIAGSLAEALVDLLEPRGTAPRRVQKVQGQTA